MFLRDIQAKSGMVGNYERVAGGKEQVEREEAC